MLEEFEINFEFIRCLNVLHQTSEVFVNNKLKLLFKSYDSKLKNTGTRSEKKPKKVVLKYYYINDFDLRRQLLKKRTIQYLSYRTC